MNLVNWDEWNSQKNNFKKNRSVNSKLVYGQSSVPFSDISIIIPTYKRSLFLHEALESAIDQTTNFEYTIIVVDNDCDVDVQTDTLMKEYCDKYENVFYYRNESNIGMFGNWNRCLEIANSKWVCLLHDDDILYPNYVEELSKYVGDDKLGAIGVYNEKYDQRISNEKLSTTGKNSLLSVLINMFIRARKGKPIGLTLQDAIHGRYIMPCATLLNKEKSITIGGFDEDYFPIADVVLYTKMIYYYKASFLPLYLAKYRVAQNESLNKETKVKFPIFIYKFTFALCKELKYSSKKIQKKSLHNAINSGGVSVISQDLNDKEIITELNFNPFIYNKITKIILQLTYQLHWAVMLFR